MTEGLDLRGKLALVTGATSGLGRECARVLALRGARVLIACRSRDKGAAMIEDIARSAGAETASRLETCACELTSMRSMRELASTSPPVDYLFLNGGVFGLPFEITADGFERTYAANYLGHFLLVHRLLGRGGLRSGARIVSTLSEGLLNPFAKVKLELLSAPAERSFSKSMASPSTKILLAHMAVELSRRVQIAGLRVTMNGVLPPATLTDNINQGGPLLRVLGRAIGPIVFKPVEQGAAVLAWAATSAELDGVTGEAFESSFARARLPAKCTDAELARRSWEATEAALGIDAWPASR